MTNTITSNELSNQPATIELWDRQAVLEFFGGNKPLHPSTLYRGCPGREDAPGRA
jgi:hypothetical protein